MKQVLLDEFGFFAGLVESPVIHNEVDIPLPPFLSNLYYFENGQWLCLEERTEDYLSIDHLNKCWKDNRTLKQIKDQKWAAIKTDRDELEFGGFVYNGNIYDSDQVSQGRILGAANLGIDQVWTLADNSTVYLSSDELTDLYAALQEHISNLHERSRVAREKIENAQTIEEIESVTL